MKLELWYSDMIRFMTDASEYGDYYSRLAGKMQPWLTTDVHICDAGSGLGYLSLALSPHVRQVTAVERHPDAAAVLERNCLQKGIANVHSQCGAVETAIPEEKYDAMVFCFFGTVRDALVIAKQQCRKDVFVFTRNYQNHRFSAGTYASGREGFPDFCAVLEHLEIPFDRETFTLEFGQPFRNLEEAHRFFRIYSKDKNKDVLTDTFVRSQLIDTGREDFPFYMPHPKHIGFIHFSVEDIPDTILEGE